MHLRIATLCQLTRDLRGSGKEPSVGRSRPRQDRTGSTIYYTISVFEPVGLSHSYLWQVLFLASRSCRMGFAVVQCGPFVFALPSLRQALINCRESPLIVLACVLQSSFA